MALQTFAAWGVIIYHERKKIKWHAEYLSIDGYMTNEDI